ncbi:MAG: PAS domain S-box protein [Candidatus Binatia bacterium]
MIATPLSEHAFAELFEKAPFALVVRSIETEAFLAANRAYEQLTGWDRADLLGRTPGEVGIFEPMAHHERNVLDVVQHQLIVERRGAIRRKDGTIVEIVFSSGRVVVAGEMVAMSILREKR